MECSKSFIAHFVDRHSVVATMSTHVELDYQNIGIEGISKLIQDQNLKNIERLSLIGCCLQKDAAILIGTHKSWSNLKELDLTDNQIGDEGAAALGKNASWLNLVELKLIDCFIGDVGAAATVNDQIKSFFGKDFFGTLGLNLGFGLN